MMRLPLRARLALVPPALLVGLALAQIAGYVGYGLSPWKGGGFGMFSTNDHGGFRNVHVLELAAGAERRVVLPGDLERRERHAREAPSQANLLRLATELRARSPGLGALRVEVWRTEFAASDLRPQRVLVASAESR